MHEQTETMAGAIIVFLKQQEKNEKRKKEYIEKLDREIEKQRKYLFYFLKSLLPESVIQFFSPSIINNIITRVLSNGKAHTSLFIGRPKPRRGSAKYETQAQEDARWRERDERLKKIQEITVELSRAWNGLICIRVDPGRTQAHADVWFEAMEEEMPIPEPDSISHQARMIYLGP